MQIKSPQSGHIGVCIIFGEILYGEAGLQGRSLFEDGLCIADFQAALEGGEMDDIFVIDEVHAEKALKLESPKGVCGTGINLADVHDAVVLRRTGFGVEIDGIVDGGVPEACVDKTVLTVKIHGHVGGGMEIVFPAEVVGIVTGLEPSGRFALHVDVEGQCKVFPKAVFLFSEALFPFPLEIEVSNLVSERDKLSVSSDGGQSEKIHDDSSVKDQLGMASIVHQTVLEVIVLLDFIEAMVNACVEVKWDVVVVFAIP